MQTALETAAGYEDLLAANVTHPHYDFRSIFQPEGLLGKRREKKRLASLRRLDATITGLLEEGETVRMVSSGLENSLLEQMFLGWVIYYMNLVALVLTDRRLLLLQVGRGGKPKTFIKQYLLNAILKANFSFAKSLKVTDGKGKVTAFARLPGKDGRRLAALLNESIRANAGTRVSAGKQSLCPNCHAAIEGIPAMCPECSQPFKSRGRAALLSLLFPGFGDMYLRHYGFATMEIATGALLWFFMVTAMMEPVDQTALSPAGAIATAAILLVPFVHVPDAIMTWFIAGKGLTPVGKPANADLNTQNLPREHQWGN